MIDHLSYSSINSYLLCHRAWKFHYIDRIPAPKSTSLLFGSVFHSAIEQYIQHKGDITQTWAATWESKLAEMDGQIAWGDDTPESLCNQGIKMLTHPDILSTIDILDPLVLDQKSQIERYVELRVPGVPIPIVGYIDMIEEDWVPCDFKTSARSWGSNKAGDELQPLFYLAALNQAGFTHTWKFRHYVFVKTKTPKVQIWETQRSLNEVFWLFGLIEEVWASIKAGIFAPTGVGSFKCSPKYCEYWEHCRGKGFEKYY